VILPETQTRGLIVFVFLLLRNVDVNDLQTCSSTASLCLLLPCVIAIRVIVFSGARTIRRVDVCDEMCRNARLLKKLEMIIV
jgi:hypothetical protein